MANVFEVVLFIVANVTWLNIVCTLAEVELNSPASPNVVLAWLVAKVHCACQLGGLLVRLEVSKEAMAGAENP